MVSREFSFRPMTEEETASIRLWQYEDVDERPGVGWPDHDDFTGISGGAVAAYCSFGRRAMMPHYLDEESFVGVSWGLRPDLVGHGHGRALLAAIVALGGERYRPRRLQAVVRKLNERSLRVAKTTGFIVVGEAGDRLALQIPTDIRDQSGLKESKA